MGQGLKYGIAAAGTLLLLTILSWNADEPAPRTETLGDGRGVIVGSTVSSKPKDDEVELGVTPISTPADRLGEVAPMAANPEPAEVPEVEDGPGPIPGEIMSTDAGFGDADEAPEEPAGAPAPVARPEPLEGALAAAPKPEAAPAATPATPSSDAERAKWVKHSVKAGESLYAIARHYLGDGSKWAAILDANPRLSSAEQLRSGMTILIPTTQPAASGPVVALGRPAAAPASAPPPAPAEAADHEVSTAVYVVKKGDTLSRIALEQLGSRALWTKLFDANRDVLPSPDKLRAGQKLVIPH